MSDQKFIVPQSLIPKEGRATSSFTVALVSALSPVLLLGIIVLGIIFIRDERVRGALIDALLLTVLPGILGGAAVGWQFINRRGDVSVAKTEALGKVLNAQVATPSTIPDAATPAASPSDPQPSLAERLISRM